MKPLRYKVVQIGGSNAQVRNVRFTATPTQTKTSSHRD